MAPAFVLTPADLNKQNDLDKLTKDRNFPIRFAKVLRAHPELNSSTATPAAKEVNHGTTSKPIQN